jgi:hypothetical protein
MLQTTAKKEENKDMELQEMKNQKPSSGKSKGEKDIDEGPISI